MADHPADVRRAPPHFARLDAVESLHRPLTRAEMAAIVAYHTFGNAGGARGVENVERIGGLDRHAVAGLGEVDGVLPRFSPIVVAAFYQRGRHLRALQDETGLGLVVGEPDRLVEQRLVGDDAAAFDA